MCIIIWFNNERLGNQKFICCSELTPPFFHYPWGLMEARCGSSLSSGFLETGSLSYLLMRVQPENRLSFRSSFLLEFYSLLEAIKHSNLNSISNYFNTTSYNVKGSIL